MSILEEVKLNGNKKLFILLNCLGVILTFLFLFVFSILAFEIKVFQEQTFIFNPIYVLVFFALFMVILTIHECIHGLFFKMFRPDKKIKYGFSLKNMVAYCTSPGSIYKRNQMICISIAPFILITFLLTLLYAVGTISPTLYIFLSAFHAAGCTGDFYYCYLLGIKYYQTPLMVEDTETGLIIYRK